MATRVDDLNYDRLSGTQGYEVVVVPDEVFGFADLVDYGGHYGNLTEYWQDEPEYFQAITFAAAARIPMPLSVLDESQTSQDLLDFYEKTGGIVALYEGSPQIPAELHDEIFGFEDPIAGNLPYLASLTFSISADEVASDEFDAYRSDGAVRIAPLITDIHATVSRVYDSFDSVWGPVEYHVRYDPGLRAYWTDDTRLTGRNNPDGSPEEFNYIRLTEHFIISAEIGPFTMDNDTVDFTDGTDPALLDRFKHALDGNDRVVLTDQNDVFWGDEGNDILSGLAGGDDLYGGDDDDTIYASGPENTSDGRLDNIRAGDGRNTIFATREDLIWMEADSRHYEISLQDDPATPVVARRLLRAEPEKEDTIHGEASLVFSNEVQFRPEDFRDKAMTQARLDALGDVIDHHRRAADALLAEAQAGAKAALAGYEDLAEQQLVSAGEIALATMEIMLKPFGLTADLLFAGISVIRDPGDANVARETALLSANLLSSRLDKMIETLGQSAVDRVMEFSSDYGFDSGPIIPPEESLEFAKEFGLIAASAVLKAMDRTISTIDFASDTMSAVQAIRIARQNLDQLESSYQSLLKSRAEHLEDLRALEQMQLEKKYELDRLPFIEYLDIEPGAAETRYSSSVSQAEGDIDSIDMAALLQPMYQNVAANARQGEMVLPANIAHEISGPAATLDGMRIAGVDGDDVITVQGADFSTGDITVTQGSAILDIDLDQDGSPDMQITLEGAYPSTGFEATTGAAGTTITLHGMDVPDRIVPISVTDAGARGVGGLGIGLRPEGETQARAATDLGGGAYSVLVAPGTTARLEGGRPHDPDSDAAITAADALEALRMAVGLDQTHGVADAFDFIRADVNGDSTVTAADALEILRYSVGLDTGHAPRWIMLDPDADLSGQGPASVSQNDGFDLAFSDTDSVIPLQALLVGNLDEIV